MKNKIPLHTGPVPMQFETNDILLESLSPTHVHLDYDAVMSSKEYLRNWSQSSWPSDEFTIEENAEDLNWHSQEHQENIAYTYTILNPLKTYCIGCIYINPIEKIAAISADEKNRLQSHKAFLSFWVRSSIQGSDLEFSIINAIRYWINESWQFTNLLYATNLSVLHQGKLFQENGLSLWMKLSQQNRYQLLWNTSD